MEALHFFLDQIREFLQSFFNIFFFIRSILVIHHALFEGRRERRSIEVFPYFYVRIPTQVLQSKLLHLFYCQDYSPSTWLPIQSFQ